MHCGTENLRDFRISGNRWARGVGTEGLSSRSARALEALRWEWKRGCNRFVWSKMTALLNDLKWYTTFFFLIGAILSFADPITDSFTLAEFYKENHLRWFMWGVIFMFIPCCTFVLVSSMTGSCESAHSVKDDVLMVLYSFNPFSPAWASFKAFLLCLKNFKKLWRGEEVDCEDHEINDVSRLIRYVKLAPFTEVITESIPQFIIQLYAASVQEEAVKIIQIISLPVSCLSIVWAFTGADELGLHEVEIEVKIKHKVLFFVTNLFLLSSRLLAICYFIIVFQWWIAFVLLFHCLIVAVADSNSRCKVLNWRFVHISIFFFSVPLDQRRPVCTSRRGGYEKPKETA